MSSEQIRYSPPKVTPGSSQRLMPLVITLVYAVLGAAWVFCSDRAVEHYLPSLEESSRFQTYKGWFYILVSAGTLYALLYRYQRRNDDSLRAVSRMTEALAASESEVRRINADLEQRVEQRTWQLAAANRELEAFVHAVSHDLRAPLRSIGGFSQALEETLPADGDGRARHYLRRIQEAGRRMTALIDDLLELSRISRAEMLPRDLDFSQLCCEVAALVRERYPDRLVTLEIEPGMRARADLRLLRIAMENLLDNAWKYTAPNPDAHVTVGMQSGGDELRYFVRDDGVGFNMAYADKLFGPFQRMHAESQFPGTGIGLVTVQRILARHGGRIWAHAEPGRGAVFTFTLPEHAAYPDALPDEQAPPAERPRRYA